MLTPNSLARVAVVGTSGAGKTTLARDLSVHLGAPHIELDEIYWGPNWTPNPLEQVRHDIDQRTSQPRWVCDGNYSVARDLIWPRATAVVWLNYSFPLVFTRALGRTFRRCISGTRLFGGNRETFRTSFFSRDSILLWQIRTHWRHRRDYPLQFAEEAHRHLRIVELRSEEAAKRFVSEAATGPPISATAIRDDKT
jgi:adenylate kinase family enzyme